MYYKMLGTVVLCGVLVAGSVAASEKKASLADKSAEDQSVAAQAIQIPDQIKGQMVTKVQQKKQEHSIYYQEKELSLSRKDAAQIKKNLPKGAKLPVTEKRVYYHEVLLPRDYQKISIFGENELTMGQAAAYIRKNAPHVKLACSVEELVEWYWKEAAIEGVRADIALCQAILETGFFMYGGDVSRHQNNFCGLGTTGGGVRGAGFSTPQLGVRAHIQHLLAYAKKDMPKTKIIDPRYKLAHDIRMERGLITKWSGLNGTWAMGKEYCEKIMAHYVSMGEIKGVAPTFDTRVKDNGERIPMKERMRKMKGR